jgi:hypothetical protein
VHGKTFTNLSGRAENTCEACHCPLALVVNTIQGGLFSVPRTQRGVAVGGLFDVVLCRG